ncbi:hypothetical protein FH972_015066 [Carpinus fangiana]|uniref:Leucine-rich repeat-containing N-terminal plant-type domain-containing protein n=1 Tax=Carpinus fangiana TaxID=176857 RepID=A0A5N6RF84_9ROSI|nr:hypothetical protein FH972_015066 [Carpinus fangiana]
MVDPCESNGEQFLGILCSNPLDNVSSRVIAIDLDGIQYDGFLTPSIGNLSELTTLNLSKNKFRSTIPETISNLKKLTTLSMAYNYLTGTIPDSITLLKNIEHLDLSGNMISGSVPVNISGHVSPVKKLKNFMKLDVSDNRFLGLINDYILSLTQLVYLDVSDNRFERIETTNLSEEETQLQLLDAENNQFHQPF